MIQRLEVGKWLYIVDSDEAWDGVGYPQNARAVWQCPLNHKDERPAYEALHVEKVAHEAKEKADREKADKENKERKDKEKPIEPEVTPDADR